MIVGSMKEAVLDLYEKCELTTPTMRGEDQTAAFCIERDMVKYCIVCERERERTIYIPKCVSFMCGKSDNFLKTNNGR